MKAVTLVDCVECEAEEHDRLLEAELDTLEAETRRPVSTRRPLTEYEQEDRWQQDDLMERRAAFLREDY